MDILFEFSSPTDDRRIAVTPATWRSDETLTRFLKTVSDNIWQCFKRWCKGTAKTTLNNLEAAGPG